MKKYSVTIEARITKTLIVEAEDADEAVWFAHDAFNVLNDDGDEDYEQDTKSVEEINEEEMTNED